MVLLSIITIPTRADVDYLDIARLIYFNFDKNLLFTVFKTRYPTSLSPFSLIN